MEAHKSNIITFIFSKNINTTNAKYSSCVCVVVAAATAGILCVCVSKENAFTYITFLVIGDLRVCRTEVYLFFSPYLHVYNYIHQQQPTNQQIM